MSTATPATPDTETFWTGLLSMLRALILGRRLPPDQLRTFLLFAEPVPYLSALQVAELLGDGCGHEHTLTPELPEGWTQGPNMNDPDSGEGCDADAQIIGLTLVNLLEREHPEWKDDWFITRCDEGYEFLSYRVLDAQRKVHPIACWFEGKLKLLRDGALKIEESTRKEVVCHFIEHTLEWLIEFCGDMQETAGLPDDYQEACAHLDAWFAGPARPDHYEILTRCASYIYDHGTWEIESWEGPFLYAPSLWDALQQLGYAHPDYHQPDKKQQSLFAA